MMIARKCHMNKIQLTRVRVIGVTILQTEIMQRNKKAINNNERSPADLANDTLNGTPDARSTPFQGSNSSDTRSENDATVPPERMAAAAVLAGGRRSPDVLATDGRGQQQHHCLSDTALTMATLGESTCSSADMYKMRAQGNRGDRSPTVLYNS